MPDARPLLITITLTPSGTDQTTLVDALSRLTVDDPCSRWSRKASGEIMFEAMDEMHLDRLVDELRRGFAGALDIGAPEVAYRKTIGSTIEIAATHKKLTADSGEFAKVKLRFEPLPCGAGFRFDNVAPDMPEELVRGIERGAESAFVRSAYAEFPIDVKVILLDAAYHATDSSAKAFELAAQTATQTALARAGAILLEPIMSVEVIIPTEFVGSVVGDLQSRRGEIRRQRSRSDQTVVDAKVPLANLFGYANQLRAFSAGRGAFRMRFDCYEPVPSPDDDPPFRPAIGMRA
jgi:elongation factor G